MNTFLPTRSCLRDTTILNLSAGSLAFLLAAVVAVCSLENANAQSAYAQHNLVSDVAGMADWTDANLVNPWGIAFSPTGPFWISDNHSGFSTVYVSAGTPQPLIVSIPTAAGGAPPAAPTGIVFNNTTNFIVVSNKAAVFIFATENGTIAAWSSGTNAVLEADNSTSEAIYKGLALGNSGGANYLYATDFHKGKIDVFDASFKRVTLAGSFLDPGMPAGFAPFGIESFGTNLFVTYAKQDAGKEDDVSGLGNGFINVFDTSGNLVKRFASNGPLNSPWGMVMAPANFGQFSGDLLIGNFGDGKINAFDPVSGASLDSLADTNGVPVSIEGLWALKFGNGAKGGNADTLYFTAGISGGGGLEDHGLFGSIEVALPIRIDSITGTGSNLTLTWSGGVGPYLVQKKPSLSDTTWLNVVTTTNQTTIVAKDGTAGFFRISDHATIP